MISKTHDRERSQGPCSRSTQLLNDLQGVVASRTLRPCALAPRDQYQPTASSRVARLTLEGMDLQLAVHRDLRHLGEAAGSDSAHGERDGNDAERE